MNKSVDVQTDIKDVNAELQPPVNSKERSLQSHLGIALQQHIDWAYTPLCVAVLRKQTTFNKEMKKSVFVEAEVDVVLGMIKKKFHEY